MVPYHFSITSMHSVPFEGYHPKVSVVIPALNERKYIRATVINVLANARNFPQFEVIVADSGSTDDTAEQVKGLIPLAKEIGINLSVVKADKRGVALARNTGAKAASADHLFFLDADTRIHSNFLARNLIKMRADNLDIAGMLVTPDSNHTIDHVVMSGANLVLKLMSYSSTPAALGVGMFVTRSAFEKLSGFDTTMHFGEDADLVCRGVKKGLRFKILDDSVCSSVRRADKEGRFTLAKKILQGLYHHCKDGSSKNANVVYNFGEYD